MSIGGNAMRLLAIDFLRGLALTFVLLDHVDPWAGPAGFFRNWTLMGLGFSDAAEAFVFLSGFTFGWVYSPRIARDGFLSCQKRVLIRTIQIYGGYLATVSIITLLEFSLRNSWWSMYPAVTIQNATMLRDALAGALWLSYQPYALGILCFYTVVLPFLPLLLALYRRWWWAAVGLSLGTYVAVQFNAAINPTNGRGGNWHINPFAWQFLLVLGMIFGHRAHNSQRAAPRAVVLTVIAVAMLLYGVFVRKSTPLLCNSLVPLRFWAGFDFWQPPLVSKTSLAPLRLLHFLALAHLVTLVLPVIPENDTVWRRPLARMFVVCGQNSLSVYCAGVILAYLSVIAFRWFGATTFTYILICVDICIIQFAFAVLVDRRRAVRSPRSGFITGRS